MREEVDDGGLDLREEVLDLRRPLHADEAGADHQHLGLLPVQVMQLVVLLEDVSAAALEEALVDVRPIADLARLLVDRREPQRLAPLVEDTEVAPGGDDAVVEIDGLHLLAEHGLDRRDTVLAVQVLHLAPDELAAHAPLDHGAKREGQRVQMLRLHVSPQHAGSILEKLLSVNNCHQVVVLEIPGDAEAGETAADDEDATLRRRHGRRCRGWN
mmetsp:Transcript_94820/g.274173  ORF Transcript_94820/g.274173 Transcript_94820/m.274173 type:complete len:214 (-) Transcript_94820:48-689(-)